MIDINIILFQLRDHSRLNILDSFSGPCVQNWSQTSTLPVRGLWGSLKYLQVHGSEAHVGLYHNGLPANLWVHPYQVLREEIKQLCSAGFHVPNILIGTEQNIMSCQWVLVSTLLAARAEELSEHQYRAPVFFMTHLFAVPGNCRISRAGLLLLLLEDHL